MPAAQFALLGGRVRTLDPDRPSAQAVAASDGTIIAVGDDDQVRACCDASTQIVDGRGMAVVPGLVDAHQHPIVGAETTSGVDLSEARSVADVCTALRAARTEAGPGDWL